ncbi:MAG: hypothetical protein N4A49_10545 [Marinifilaceae bacterium]|jgi:hypothetical protein|nr:hypothetical protein [Marinifilaceae bacterium]
MNTARKLLLISLLFFSLNLFSQTKIVSLDTGEKIILYADKTWDYYKSVKYDYDFSKIQNNEIPKNLRQGIRANKNTITIAMKMHFQGWQYFMPIPKSSQAAWGNNDGRTTWWKGYWYNLKTKKYSRSTPVLRKSGDYKGDYQCDKGRWRNGGSPHHPSKIMWLLSKSGGIKPYI